jgi:hypothetical protein
LRDSINTIIDDDNRSTNSRVVLVVKFMLVDLGMACGGNLLYLVFYVQQDFKGIQDSRAAMIIVRRQKVKTHAAAEIYVG